MDRAFMDEYYNKMRADDIEELSSQRNEDYSDRADDYKAAKQALLEGLRLSHLFSGNLQTYTRRKRTRLLFDRVYVTELLARDEFAKGAYMLGARRSRNYASINTVPASAGQVTYNHSSQKNIWNF